MTETLDLNTMPIWDLCRHDTSRFCALLMELIKEGTACPRERVAITSTCAAIIEHVHGEDSFQLIEVLSYLAQSLNVTDHADEAEKVQRRCIDLIRKHGGVGDCTLGGELCTLACILERQNRLSEAEAACRQACDYFSKENCEDDSAGETLHHLSGIMRRAGHPDAACMYEASGALPNIAKQRTTYGHHKAEEFMRQVAKGQRPDFRGMERK